MKQILYKFRLILTIKTQNNSQTTFDKNEGRGEIWRVKYVGKHVVHGVTSENKMCFGASWRHTNMFGAWKNNYLRTITPGPLTPPPGGGGIGSRV